MPEGILSTPDQADHQKAIRLKADPGAVKEQSWER